MIPVLPVLPSLPRARGSGPIAAGESESLKRFLKRLAADLSINGQLVQGTRVELASSVLQTDDFPVSPPPRGLGEESAVQTFTPHSA
jgi:hypothetical protein